MRAGGRTTPGGPKLLLRLPDEPSPLQRDLVHLQQGREAQVQDIDNVIKRTKHLHVFLFRYLLFVAS